jgi:hypothetical protein
MASDDFAQVRGSLQPRVYGFGHVELDRMELTAAGQDSGLEAVRAGAPGVMVGVSIDKGANDTRASQRQLDDWGVTLDEALYVALANSTTRAYQPKQVMKDVWLVNDWSFAGAVWLAPQILRQVPVRGHELVITPQRGSTLVGADNWRTLTVMAGIVGDLLQEGQRIEMAEPCRLGSQGWQTVPFDDARIRKDVAQRPSRLFLEQLYARQQSLLQAHVGEDWFVASYKVWQGPDGSVRSGCTWSEGVPSLLPVTDTVYLAMNDMTRLQVPWQTLLATVPDLMTPCGYYPERYRVSAFPVPEQRQTMADFAQ